MKNQEVNNYTTTNREGDVVIYDVPVVRHIWSESDAPIFSLRNKIQQAKTVSEINALIEKGESTFKSVSPKTIKQWKKMAEKRIHELTLLNKVKKRNN